MPTTPKSKSTLKKTPREQVADILLRATPEAARFLVAALADDSLTQSARSDCAKEILNRVYGRAAVLEGAGEGGVTIELDEGVRAYAD